MRILLAHNYYGSAAPSGENSVFDTEKELLRKNGHEVSEFLRNSDTIRERGLWGKVRGALSTPWNPFAAREIKEKIEESRADIVHVHNTFPLISPAIFHSIGHRAARVLTLHNYRLFCPSAIPTREGRICTDCLGKRSVLSALWHGCYRGSHLATLPVAVNVTLHKHLRTWTKQVDAFVALTEFQRELMIEAGLPADLVHVKPHYFPGEAIVRPWEDRPMIVVFAGRLTAEKGVMALVRAWLMWGTSAPELRVVGDGDLRWELEKLAGAAPEVPIRFLGKLERTAAQKEIAGARLLVFPSECLETFGLAVIEAFAFGTPTAVSNIGSLPSIVKQGENGVVFESGDPLSMLSVVRKVWEETGKLEHLANGARRSYESTYSEAVNYRMLMKIYEKAMEVCRRRRGAE